MKKLMHFCVTVLLFTVAGYTHAQQVDSVSLNTITNNETWPPAVDVGLDIYVSSASGINAVSIKLGTEAGGNDFLQQSYAAANLTFQYNNTLNKYVCHIAAGRFPVIPPYIQVTLQKQGGPSAPYTKYLLQ